MSWNKYRDLFKKGEKDESYFILGIEIGNASSAISFFDVNRSLPEILDVSGGYGRPDMPTAMQFVADSKEMIYGEYAKSFRNSEKDVVIRNMVKQLGKHEFLQLDNKFFSTSALLSMFIRELIANCRNINPKAEIAGIIVSIPSYVSELEKSELSQAFSQAELGGCLIDFEDERKCVFAKYLFDNNLANQTVMMLNFGSEEISGGLYQVGDNNEIRCDSSVFDTELSVSSINSKLEHSFENVCMNKLKMTEHPAGLLKEQLEYFAYSQRDVLFQKDHTQKQSKLYFNYSYPPFEIVITNQMIEELTAPFIQKFDEFVNKIFLKTTSEKINALKVDKVICYGSGFEMLWAKKFVKTLFGDSKLVFFKSPATAAAEGASILAADALSAFKVKQIKLIDTNRLGFDIGVNVLKNKSSVFVPLIERNSFWWQLQKGKNFILNQETLQDVTIDVCKREADGGIHKFCELAVSGLPERPIGTTKLGFSLKFQNSSSFIIAVEDLGFGELYPSSGYIKETIIGI